jgi:uncharacterized damage-inducible protein DinB
MEWQQLLIDILERGFQGLEKALADLSQADLNEQPHPDCNNIGWMTWHLTRVQDRIIADLSGEQQVWMKNEWYTRFNRLPDPKDSGSGHKSEDVAAFESPEAKTLLEYHKAVLEQSKRYLSGLSTVELERKIEHPVFPTVEAFLVTVLNDVLQHIGQVAYLRGLLKAKS